MIIPIEEKMKGRKEKRKEKRKECISEVKKIAGILGVIGFVFAASKVYDVFLEWRTIQRDQLSLTREICMELSLVNHNLKWNGKQWS